MKVSNILNSNGFSVDYSIISEAPRLVSFDISYETDITEFQFEIECSTTSEFRKKFRDYAYSFDPDEYIKETADELSEEGVSIKSLTNATNSFKKALMKVCALFEKERTV